MADPLEPDSSAESLALGAIPLADEPGPDSEAVPKAPRAKPAAPAPLPRLWKADPEPEDDAPPPRAKEKAPKEPARARRSAEKPRDAGKPGTPKGVLVEETPNLDTVETRQRVRMAVGAGLVGLGLLSCWGLYRWVAPAAVAPEPSMDELLAGAVAAGKDKAREEKEAGAVLGRAKEMEKQGKTDMAVSFLNQLASKYPGTKAALDAQVSLERSRQKLPLFAAAGTTTPKGPGTVPGIPQPKGPAAPPALPPPGLIAAAPAPAPAPATMPVPAAVIPQVPTVKALPAGFHAKPDAPVHASGWPSAIVGDRDGATLVLVPGGTFTQGRDDSDPTEGPAHLVRLSTYYIDRHEVTVRQFNLFQKEAGRRADRQRALTRDAVGSATAKAVSEAEDLPVVMVSARDAKAYADWAGKRLPTEAQWEHAARSPDNRTYPWGALPPSWGRPREPRQIDAVMSFPEDVTPSGVFDLGGNAWEWTKDWYDPRYYQLYRNTQANDPEGPTNRPRSQQLVVKGGAKDWVVTRREGLKFETRLPYLGFRCALPVEGPGNAFEPAAPVPARPNGAPGTGGENGVEVVPF